MSLTESVSKIVSKNANGLLAAHPLWCRVNLGDVVAILNGFAFPSSRFSRLEGIPLLRIRDIQSEHAGTFYAGQFDPIYLVRAGDLVVGMDGDFNCCLWHGPEALLNQRVCKLTPDERSYDRKFLGYVLPGYLSAINAETSSITVKHLSSKTVAKIPLPLPPVCEQHRIVAELDKQFTRLDAAISALKRVQSNLKRYRASVLKAACEGRLVPTEADLARAEGRDYETADTFLARVLAERRAQWEARQLAKSRKRLQGDERKLKYREPTSPDTTGLPGLPNGWGWATIDQLAAMEPNSITDGPFGSNLKTSHYTAAGPRVIRLQNIGDGIFVDEHAHISNEHFESLRKHCIAAGDIVIAALGDHPPRACVIPASVGPAIVKADCIRFRPEADLALSAYLTCALNAEPTRRRVASVVHGVGRPRLNLGEIKAIVLPLPPLTEQRRIVAEVERRLSIIEDLERVVATNLSRAERVRQAILKRAFEGKLVPRDPNDEPASALLERIRAERAAQTGVRETRPRRTPSMRKDMTAALSRGQKV